MSVIPKTLAITAAATLAFSGIFGTTAVANEPEIDGAARGTQSRTTSAPLVSLKVLPPTNGAAGFRDGTWYVENDPVIVVDGIDCAPVGMQCNEFSINLPSLGYDSGWRTPSAGTFDLPLLTDKNVAHVGTITVRDSATGETASVPLQYKSWDHDLTNTPAGGGVNAQGQVVNPTSITASTIHAPAEMWWGIWKLDEFATGVSPTEGNQTTASSSSVTTDLTYLYGPDAKDESYYFISEHYARSTIGIDMYATEGQAFYVKIPEIAANTNAVLNPTVMTATPKFEDSIVTWAITNSTGTQVATGTDLTVPEDTLKALADGTYTITFTENQFGLTDDTSIDFDVAHNPLDPTDPADPSDPKDPAEPSDPKDPADPNGSEEPGNLDDGDQAGVDLPQSPIANVSVDYGVLSGTQDDTDSNVKYAVVAQNGSTSHGELAQTGTDAGSLVLISTAFVGAGLAAAALRKRSVQKN